MPRSLSSSLVILALLLAACRPAQPAADDVDADVPTTASASEASGSFGASATETPSAPALGRASASPPRDMLGLAEAVAKQGDPHALAVAAMLRDAALSGAGPAGSPAAAPVRGMDDTVRDWLDEAERRAPDDLIALLFALYLERHDESRRQALIARWRRLEPRNLAPLLHATLPEPVRFEQAQSTDVFDTHYDEMLRAFILQLSRAPSLPPGAQPGVPRQEQEMAMAIVLWSAVAQPAFQRVTGPCGMRPMPELRRRQCRWIGEVLMRRSDTLTAEAVGADMAARLAANAAERARAEAHRREGAWLAARGGDAHRRDARAFVRRYRELLFDQPQVTERGIMRQLAVEAGFPPLPPPGWQRDGDGRSRAPGG